MKVFKFGGASVKDAAGVQNLVLVLEKVGFISINSGYLFFDALSKSFKSGIGFLF